LLLLPHLYFLHHCQLNIHINILVCNSELRSETVLWSPRIHLIGPISLEAPFVVFLIDFHLFIIVLLQSFIVVPDSSLFASLHEKNPQK